MTLRAVASVLTVLLCSNSANTSFAKPPPAERGDAPGAPRLVPRVSEDMWEEAPEFLRYQLMEPTFDPVADEGRTRPRSAGDWRKIIDELWGEGLPTEAKLRQFDDYWNAIDRYFACFQGLDLDWDAVRERYRPEIEAGVSRGRFAAILNHMGLALRESHTQFNDTLVNRLTYPSPGVPLMWVGGWGYDAQFGACLTPLPDGSLLVYKTVDDHPLGLEPGDRVLGYDGVPWSELYPKLLEAELPLLGYWASSPETVEHSFLMAAGRNWHLFDRIDVVKHRWNQVPIPKEGRLAGVGGSPETVTSIDLPNGPLVRDYVFCGEQLPVPGVTPPDLLAGETVSWGLLPGDIGYIYVYAWIWTAGTDFERAVRELTLEHDTHGLIIDFRVNFGGDMFLSNKGLGLLFDRPVDTIGFVKRAGSKDHLEMVSAADPIQYRIPGRLGYDHPIAVLTGPGALSSGDQVALRMTFHPMVRTFGKSTATAFNGPIPWPSRYSDYDGRLAFADAYRVSDPENFLTHDEFIVDQPVWLDPDGVARGIDTVVAEALHWIHNAERDGHRVPIRQP